MQTAAIIGPRQAVLRDVPDPQVREDFVVVKVQSAPMCTEHQGFRDGVLTTCLGHEAAGEVVAVAQSGRVRVGERVAVMPGYACSRCEFCQSGDYIYCQHPVDPLEICGSPVGTATYAQYLIKADWLLLPLPDDISYDHGAMTCCGIGPGFGAMQNMSVSAFDTVLIAGMGPVGLGSVINGIYRGARIIGLESNPYRAKLALELGASAVVDPNDSDALTKIKDLTGGRGADKAIDCTAIPAAQQFLIEATRRRGHICFVGWGGRVEIGNMVPQGLTLQGSWHWNLRDAPKVLQMVRDCSAQLDKLITHRFPMNQVQQAFELQTTGQCGKVVLHPWA